MQMAKPCQTNIFQNQVKGTQFNDFPIRFDDGLWFDIYFVLESIAELNSKTQNAIGETISDQDSQECLETDYLIFTWKDSPPAEVFKDWLHYFLVWQPT